MGFYSCPFAEHDCKYCQGQKGLQYRPTNSQRALRVQKLDLPPGKEANQVSITIKFASIDELPTRSRLNQRGTGFMHGHEGEYTQEFTASNDIVFQVGAHFVPVGDIGAKPNPLVMSEKATYLG